MYMHIIYLYYMILICTLKLDEKTITPPTLYFEPPHPDSWPRVKKNNPCSRFSLFRRLVTVS